MTEELDDTPRPTEKYFMATHAASNESNDINVFDSRSTPHADVNSTVYSTASPIALWKENSTTMLPLQQDGHSENHETHDMSPFLPEIENSKVHEKTYSVTENSSDADQSPMTNHGQSPFLPELESNDTIVNNDHDNSPSISEEVSKIVVPLNESSTLAPLNKTMLLETSSSKQESDEDYDFMSFTKNSTTEKPLSIKEVVDETAKKINDLFGSSTVNNLNASSSTTTEKSLLNKLQTFSDEELDSSEKKISTTESPSIMKISPETTQSPSQENVDSSSETPPTTTNPNSNEDSKIIKISKAIDDLSPSSTTEKLNATTETPIIRINLEPKQELTTETVTEVEETSTDKVSTTTSFTKDLNDDKQDDFINTQDLLENDNAFDSGALKVLPLDSGPKTTEPPKTSSTEASNTSENEINQKTTGHFLESTTFLSINSESKEKSLNQVEETENEINNKESRTLLKDENSSKLFKDEFLDTLSKKSEPKNSTSTDFVYSKCTTGQFQCINGTSIKDSTFCISLSEVCDSINHCSDNSDEDLEQCKEKNCNGNFQCTDGTCLSRKSVCNGILECLNGSDEKDCDQHVCKFDEISCNKNGTGHCLPLAWKCNKREDCQNGFDEENCPENCSNNEYYCSTQGRCIPESYRCNGKVDCLGAEDERLCDCPLDAFKCNSGGCVPKSQVCNGQAECSDLSDEWGCFQINKDDNSLSIKHVDDSQEEYYKVCGNDWTDELSNNICMELGFVGMLNWSHQVEKTKEEKYLVANNSSDSLLSNLSAIESSACDNGAIILQCKEFICGVSKSQTELRVNGGVHTNNSEFPSLAILFNKEYNLKCTSTIISPMWVLASYSCVIGKTEFIYRNEEHNIKWSLYAGSSVFEDDFKTNETVAQLANVSHIVEYPQVFYHSCIFNFT